MLTCTAKQPGRRAPVPIDSSVPQRLREDTGYKHTRTHIIAAYHLSDARTPTPVLRIPPPAETLGLT